jgi:formate-dependent nitrite reductase membrane component NrfD
VNEQQQGYQSYYGKPIIKEPVWKPVIPLYFFIGGLGGASAALSWGASLMGHRRLSRNATFLSLVALAISPVLLIVDLGRPSRFFNMLRMFKVTSPMSVGSWLLSATGGAVGVTAVCEALDILPRLRSLTRAVGGVLGLPVATYTAALIADTAVPVWHDARRELPLVFAGGSAASAGAAAMLVTPPSEAGPARRLALAGALLESAATTGMEQRLGTLIGEPYRQGNAGLSASIARNCTRGGAVVVALAGKKRLGSILGATLLLAGSLIQRWSVVQAGHQSARDPKYTVVPQRQR